jgi:hypothetical protein
VGKVRFVDGQVEVQADDDVARLRLVHRLEEDLRAAGVAGYSAPRVTRSAA